MIETERRRKGTRCKRLGCVQPRFCSVWVHRTVRWLTGQCPVRQAGSSVLAALGNSSSTYDYNSPDCPVCTGLSGEPTVGLGQRSAARSAQDTWPSQRSEGGTGLSGVHRTCPVRQRLQSSNGRLRQIRKEIRTGQCPVVHRTVRCTSRQKARIASWNALNGS